MADEVTEHEEPAIPAMEQLIELLREPDAPPVIILDLTNSDGDLTGLARASLDRRDNLIVKKVS